ncbi:homeobox protein 2-like [Onthophagus taurus]|uniref:homeobox protein 2-like n=1 Tax=Onthophagus taurus TaxID=166361 RepID=UPI0039BE42BC
MINLDSTSTLSYLKPEMWPKFRGTKDKIHPMTYLNNLIRLTTDIDDPKLILNLIQLTLEEQALEWYEMAANKCHNLDDFKNEFVKQLWNSNQQHRQKLKLLNGKYNENWKVSREIYACDVYNRSKYIQGLEEKEITEILIKHFVNADNVAVVYQNISSMNELMEILRRLDDFTENQRKERNLNYQNINYGHTKLNYNYNYDKKPEQNQRNYNYNNNNYTNCDNNDKTNGSNNRYGNNYSRNRNGNGHDNYGYRNSQSRFQNNDYPNRGPPRRFKFVSQNRGNPPERENVYMNHVTYKDYSEDRTNNETGNSRRNENRQYNRNVVDKKKR